MSAELIIARPATGKTQYCIQRVQDVLASSPLPTVWIIVPDRLQAAAFRRRLAQSGGAIGARVGTFGDLYRNILEQTGKNVPTASVPLTHFIIQEVVQIAFEKGTLIHYASLRSMPGFYLALHDAFAELKRYLVFPEDFVAYARNGTPAQQELAALYSLYQNRLRELGWADPEGLSWLAVEKLEKQASVADSIRLLVVDGFDSFTGAQLRALALLAVQVHDMLVTFPGETNSQRVAYRRFDEVSAKLTDDISPTIKTFAQSPFLSPDILHLENHLFEPDDVPVQKAENLSLLEARSPVEEARESLRWIKKRVIRDGLDLSECAIFTPNPDTYNAFLRASATEFGIPVHYSHGTALAISPPIVALVNLLNLPVQNFKSRLLFNTLRSPYFNFGIDPASIDILEEISRASRIVDGQAQWQETWGRLNPSDLDEVDLDDERKLPGLPRGVQAQALQGLLEAFFSLLRIPDEAISQAAWVSWLEDLIDHLDFYPRAASERDEIACESLREILRALVLAENVLGPRNISYEEFINILHSSINGAGLPEPRPQVKSSLFIGKMIEARGVRYKAVALLGFSEGIFPVVERPDPFLDEALRQALGLERRLNREQFGLFYQAVTRSDQYLLLTRPYLTESGEDWEASPFWKDVQKRFDESALVRVQPDNAVPLDDAASSQELLFWAVRHRKLPVRFDELTPRWESLRHARNILNARRAKIPTGAHEGYVADLAPLMGQRYAAGSIWSASRLESYGKCPHEFYVKVALGLEPRTTPVLGWDISQLGSILHKIFEEVYCTAADPTDCNSLLAILPSVAERIFEDAPREFGFRPTALWEMDKAQLIAILQQTIEELMAESDGWTPIAFEQKFGIDHIPPLEIDLGNETMRVRGVIDRVDRNHEGELRVIDYKTGSSHQEARDLKSGARLQLPLYALAAQQTMGPAQVVDGFYWQIQSKKASSLRLYKFETSEGHGVEEAVRVVIEHLKKILAGIRAAEFPPIPPKGGCPSYCPAVQWCWRYQPGWGGAK